MNCPDCGVYFTREHQCEGTQHVHVFYPAAYAPYRPRARRPWWRMPLVVLAGAVAGVIGGRALALLPVYVGLPVLVASVLAVFAWLVLDRDR